MQIFLLSVTLIILVIETQSHKGNLLVQDHAKDLASFAYMILVFVP